jgi:hypothetical protein
MESVIDGREPASGVSMKESRLVGRQHGLEASMHDVILLNFGVLERLGGSLRGNGESIMLRGFDVYRRSSPAPRLGPWVSLWR